MQKQELIRKASFLVALMDCYSTEASVKLAELCFQEDEDSIREQVNDTRFYWRELRADETNEQTIIDRHQAIANVKILDLQSPQQQPRVYHLTNGNILFFIG